MGSELNRRFHRDRWLTVKSRNERYERPDVLRYDARSHEKN